MIPASKDTGVTEMAQAITERTERKALIEALKQFGETGSSFKVTEVTMVADNNMVAEPPKDAVTFDKMTIVDDNIVFGVGGHLGDAFKIVAGDEVLCGAGTTPSGLGKDVVMLQIQTKRPEMSSMYKRMLQITRWDVK